MTSEHKMLPAEWQCESAILMSWPHGGTDWAYMIEQVQQCYLMMLRAFTRVAKVIMVAPDVSEVANAIKGYVDTDKIILLEMPTNDTWARDFGMMSVSSDAGWQAIDYKFNGWGLKFPACHDNLINSHILQSGIINTATTRYVNRLGFVLEGGSIDIDEKGVLLTTKECLLSPNRNGDLTQQEIEAKLRAELGTTKVVWLSHGALEGDDTDSHVDTLARFLPSGTIVYTACDRPDDTHYHELAQMASEIAAITDTHGKKYRAIPLPIPEAIYDTEGQRLPATYANFLIVNGTIFLPIYGDKKYDQIAIEAIKGAAPGYTVVPIDCRALIQQHGSLHCATMQIPAEMLR